jgi:lysyl endopeptidase
VASDAGFATIVHSGAVPGTSFQAMGLAPSTTYYWRVRANNPCGVGANSVTRSFTTAAEVCFNGNVAIPDGNASGVTNVLSGSSGVLTDLNVRLEATHSWVGDVQMTLTHESTTVALLDRPGYTGSGFGCSANDIAVTADDEGTDGTIEAACSTTPPAVGGVRTPNAALSAFDGQDFSGNWTLTVSDSAGGDTGNLMRWCLYPSLGVDANGIFDDGFE